MAQQSMGRIFRPGGEVAEPAMEMVEDAGNAPTMRAGLSNAVDRQKAAAFKNAGATAAAQIHHDGAIHNPRKGS